MPILVDRAALAELASMSRGDGLRVGAVNYLNTKPLIHGFERFAPGAKLMLDLPSRLADRLAASDLDVALIPSIEAFQNPDYTIVSDACIACRGPVLSVKLFCRVPVAKIKTLALDEGSRTSVALTRILLAERHGLTPAVEPLPIGATLADTTADAVLLIGDRAIHSPIGAFVEVWDLGDQWNRWAEASFVFAMWTARPGVDTSQIEPALAEARDAGLASLPAIAEIEAPKLGLTQPECLAYLRDNLHFQLGPAERRGLRLFHELSRKMGLAPRGVELGFASCQSAR